MNKKKLISVLLLITTMMCLALFMVSCAKAEAHVCASVCEECQKCTSDCTDPVCANKCEGHVAKVDITEGVYNAVMGSYELLIKFYDAENYYMQTETTGYRGKYEIKDEEITFTRTQADGTDFNTAEWGDEARWLTSNKTIYFYQEDGVTPIDYVVNKSEAASHNPNTLEKGICYAYGTKPYVLAYNTEEDQIQSFAGVYGSRTLSHTKLRSFAINNEKSIIQGQYMVKEMPTSAKAGEKESDYFLMLSQKGYEANIPSLSEIGIDAGRFTKTDDVTYALNDTISGSKATLVLSDNGATVSSGDKSISLVIWEDVTPYAVEVNGEAYGGAVKARVRFNEDGTLIIYAGAVNFGGNYVVNPDNSFAITNVSESSPVSILSANVDGNNVIANLKVQAGANALEIEAKGELTGTLLTQGAKVLLAVESEETVFANYKMVMEFKEDSTVSLLVGGKENVSAKFSLDLSGVPTIKFDNASKGTFTYALSNSCTVTWTGMLSDNQASDNKFTFIFPNTELANLKNVVPQEKHVVVGEAWNTRETKIVFNNDGTLGVSVGGSVVATANWAFAMAGAMPSVTIENSSNGSVTPGWGSEDTAGMYVFTWIGRISPQMPNDTTLVFAMPTAELANLR